MHLVNSIGDSIDFPTAKAVIGNLSEQGFISGDNAAIMLAAMNDRCYSSLSPDSRNTVRAAILKQMLIK